MKLEKEAENADKKLKGMPKPKSKGGTAGVTAFELIKRAYESNTLDKLRDFLSVEPQLVT